MLKYITNLPLLVAASIGAVVVVSILTACVIYFESQVLRVVLQGLGNNGIGETAEAFAIFGFCIIAAGSTGPAFLIIMRIVDTVTNRFPKKDKD